MLSSPKATRDTPVVVLTGGRLLVTRGPSDPTMPLRCARCQRSPAAAVYDWSVEPATAAWEGPLARRGVCLPCAHIAVHCALGLGLTVWDTETQQRIIDSAGSIPRPRAWIAGWTRGSLPADVPANPENGLPVERGIMTYDPAGCRGRCPGVSGRCLTHVTCPLFNVVCHSGNQPTSDLPPFTIKAYGRVCCICAEHLGGPLADARGLDVLTLDFLGAAPRPRCAHHPNADGPLSTLPRRSGPPNPHRLWPVSMRVGGGPRAGGRPCGVCGGRVAAFNGFPCPYCQATGLQY